MIAAGSAQDLLCITFSSMGGLELYSRLIAVYLIVQQIAGSFTIDKFADRLLIQKSIYLLQVLGIDLRFRFGWFPRGPYSEELAQVSQEIMSAKQELDKISPGFHLQQEAATKVLAVKNAIEKYPDDLDRAKWAELLSSIDYILNIAKPNESIEHEKLVSLLAAYGKDQFTVDHVKSACQFLNDLGLTNRRNHEKAAS
jgi:uncharacterized protein YwgA